MIRVAISLREMKSVSGMEHPFALTLFLTRSVRATKQYLALNSSADRLHL